MRTFYNLNDFLKSRFSSQRFVVTIGIFDGLHRAHQKIINRLIKRARLRGLSSLLITFNPHPLNILNSSKKVPLLISLQHRLRLLEEKGLDYAIVLRFNKRLSHMTPRNFIQKVLGKIHIAEIIVGSNFLFGRNKKGSLRELNKFSNVYGYKVSFIETLKSSGKIISSTWIRKLILKGDLEKASQLLLKPVTVLGTVVKGTKKGRIIGYPTANINPHHEAVPPSGVYAVKVKIQNKVYGGVLNIGIRPTFGSGSYERDPTIEVHIFNFNKCIYGKDIEIVFLKQIRKEKKFKDVNDLKTQIAKDETLAKQILSRERLIKNVYSDEGLQNASICGNI